jgi:hypothetical protein
LRQNLDTALIVQGHGMELPRVSIPIRNLLALTAMTALALGMDSMRQRRNDDLQKVEYHTVEEEHYRACQTWGSENAALFRSPESLDLASKWEKLAEQNGILAQYHAKMRLKYEFAASHPWQILSPDPPMPHDPHERSPEEWAGLRLIYPWLPEQPSGQYGLQDESSQR